jgi:phage terminase large subunit
MTQEININSITEALVQFQGDPFVFLEEVWGLTPQPIKHRYAPMLQHLMTTPAKYFNLEASLFTNDMFGEFKQGKHLTWQQTLLLIAVKRAINDCPEQPFPRQISVCSGKGTGKDIDLNETVWRIERGVTTPVKAKQIKVGDTILGLSKPTKVIGVFPQTKRQRYDVIFDDGSKVNVSGDHFWTVSDHQTRVKLDKRNDGDKKSEEGKWETITTEEIMKRGLRMWSANIARFRVPKQIVQGHINVPDAYVVGVWYGDGHRGNSQYTKPDEFVANKIEKHGYELSKVFPSGARTVYTLKQRLSELGVPIDTKEGLPPNFLSWDIESRTELLRGLMDTDGTCDTNGNAEFSSSIKELAEDTALLIRSLGGKTKIRIKEKTFYKGKEGERVYCKPSCRIQVSTKFNPFSLPRKAERYKVACQDRYHVRFITSIKPTTIEEGVCFKVDSTDELFLIGKGLIPTHNTHSVSQIVLWFMFSFPKCRVMATAPTGDQLFSVLWSELSSAIQRMKDFYRDQYIWQNKFIRMVASPMDWFARAKTSGPGEHGALAGLHAPSMLAVVDEAAAVEEGVIDEARYTMTNENNLIILISNAHTATSFFKSTFEEGSGWINIIFNAEESPIVSASTIAKVLRDCGGDREHDKYRVHVRGLFPKAGLLDDSEGWRRMYDDKWIDALFATDKRDNTLRSPYIGVDVGGEGSDSSEIYARDAVLARHVYSESTSTPETIAKLTIRAIETLEADSRDVSIDNFGVGADVTAKIALLSEKELFCRGVNVGMKCEDPDDRRVYFNERARLADMLLKWGIQGGRVVPDERLRKELETIYCKEEANGKLQVMPKKKQRALGLKSCNLVDSLWLTFAQDTAFAMRVPRGDHLYYPDRPEEEKTNTNINPLNKHRMIPMV